MVSTRGVKFKFSEGEKVLCYEPDQTKAKVLYHSKVLKLVVSHDNHGRKVPEYLIHFSGWSNSWNRCVPETGILPDNEENRILKRKLAEEAALQLKGKNKRKLPPIIKETLSKKECIEGKEEMDDLNQMDTSEYRSESELSEDDTERPTKIDIPQSLKEQLEEDLFYITRQNKIVKIPCEPNVVSILESYIKHLAANLLCAAPPKNSKKRNEPFIPEDVESKLDFCKEVMDGIRVYFDFTLPHLLLYHQEQKQYYTVGTVCKPICGVKRKTQGESSTTDTKMSSSTSMVSDANPHSEQDANKTGLVTLAANTPALPTAGRGRPSLRNSCVSRPEPANEETSINGTVSSIPATKMKGSNRHYIKKGDRKEKMTGPKRVLRSTDKLKTDILSAVTDTNKKNCPESEISIPTRPESPILSCSPPRHGRGTPKSVPSDSSQTAVTSSSETQLLSSQHSPNPVNIPSVTAPTVVTSSSQHISFPPALNMSVTNSICSSASSTRSSLSSPRLDFPPYPPLNASGMLSEIRSWNMLPPYVYEQVPAPPSVIYGAQHLLRLFVKLPDLIYKMNIQKKKLVPLMNSLVDFLNYLSERREETFLPSAYVDANETFLEQNSSVSY